MHKRTPDQSAISRRLSSGSHATAPHSGNKESARGKILSLTEDQIAQIGEHISEMASRSPELRHRRFLFKKPASEQYHYAKRAIDQNGRTLLAQVLQARMEGTEKAEWKLNLSTDDALTMWLSVQHARLGRHTKSQRHDYRIKQTPNVMRFCGGLMLVPVLGLGLIPIKLSASAIKQNRKTYYNSAFRPEFRDAFSAFMEMLSSPRVATEHKLRIAQALVDEHMRRAETIPPEQVADIEAAIAQHQHMASPVEGASDTLPSVSMDSDAPYRAVIAYAASLAWRKKLSEVQCKELLQRAGKTLATDAHRMEIVKMPTMPALKQPMPALDYLDLASLQAPLPDVSIDPESRGTTGKWNQRRVAPIGVFGPIPSYLNQGYKTINNELREFGHSYDGRKVKEALEKYIPNYAYTGISFRGSFALDNSKTQTPYCAEGGTFTDRSFFSTTLSAISGARYAKRPPDYNIASTVRSGLFNTMFHVIGRTGVCVGGSEWEVLYRSNTVFDVIFNGFDYRNRMHKPVLVEKDVEVPKGSQKKDILPPQPLGKAIDTAHALSNNTFKTSMEELKFHVATAL